MWCVCAQSYMVQSKKIFDHFICFWKWFLSLFVFMFTAYFVFHCLNMFCIEKKTSVRVFRGSAGDLLVAKPQSRVHPEAFGDSLAACSRLTCDSRKFSQLNLATRLVAKRPKSAFYRAFSWEACFKPLPSSLKPLFQYFYIKTQPMWMVFHSINISKVIINSFH